MSLINSLVTPLVHLQKKISNVDYEIIESEVCFDLIIVHNPTKPNHKETPKYEASLCKDGVGGTYFIKDENGVIIGVFKPTDEEPGAVNDPKICLKNPPMQPGGGAIREIAAYLLDHGRRAGVPETYFMSNVANEAFYYAEGPIRPKSGSVQKYIDNIGDADSMGASRYCVEDVHSIGILDIRLHNMDRNHGNILVRKETDVNGVDKFRLVPIDHAYTLPSTLGGAWFEWMYWKQAKVPFSKETLDYIRLLDIDEDARILRSLGIGDEYIRTMRISTILLKIAAEAGKSLYEIAELICRKRLSEESVLEKLVLQSEQNGLENFYETYERLVTNLVTDRLMNFVFSRIDRNDCK